MCPLHVQVKKLERELAAIDPAGTAERSRLIGGQVRMTPPNPAFASVSPASCT